MRHKAHPFLQTSQSNKKGEASTTSPFFSINYQIILLYNVRWSERGLDLLR